MSENANLSRGEQVRSKVLHAAAKLFLEKGYTDSKMREISTLAGVNYGSMMFIFRSKEDILSELVGFVLEGQFEATTKMLQGKTDDKILFYAAETTLQLYLAESSEHMRELYSLSYSQQASSNIIYEKITLKLAEIFKEQFPNYTQGEFYEKELASAGIMRNYMTRPCGIYFTMDRKVRAFLENTFLLYEIPKKKIEEAIKFVEQFDWKSIADGVIKNMLTYLESKI
ncbi:MAG: TetR/AcrR family transcriptional regulator [Paludibacteraceae bacterium]|nr:TetR/AcrR family transcriptional regulator [Paludibacteraceae bacterium]